MAIPQFEAVVGERAGDIERVPARGDFRIGIGKHDPGINEKQQGEESTHTGHPERSEAEPKDRE
jgi:hypothetical protein